MDISKAILSYIKHVINKSSKNTVVIVRGTPSKDSHLDLLSQLEKIGACLVNSRDAMTIAVDKYRTYLRLLDFGLHQPKTVLIPNKESVEQAVENLDKKYYGWKQYRRI